MGNKNRKEMLECVCWGWRRQRNPIKIESNEKQKTSKSYCITLATERLDDPRKRKEVNQWKRL